MLKEKYICDAGSLAIEFDDGSIMHIGNDYGDGEFKTYVFNSFDEFQEYKNNHYQFATMKEKNYHFVSLNYFNNANVLNYDCFEPNQTRVGWIKKEILFTLSGKYEIYVNYGKIYFVKISEACKIFKHNFINALENFKRTYDDLKDIFVSSDIDLNQYIVNNYPFDKSFEELNIDDWINSIKENLEKGEM